MKNKALKSVFGSVALTMLSVIALASCAKKHNFADKWTFDSTNHWHVCQDKDCQEKGDLSEHSFDAGVVKAESSETTTGLKVYTCSTCGYQKEEILPKLEHTHRASSQYFSDANDHWHICLGCEQPIDKAAHQFGAGVVKIEATEHNPGLKVYTCSVCHYEKEETLPKLEHTHVEKAEWKSDATRHWHECEGCEEKLSLANHTASDWIIDTQADYGVPGLRHKECTVCHRELEREPISALAPETDSVNILVGLDKTYDGNAVTLDIANIEVASNRTPTIEWYEGNTKLASAPVNAGSYSVKAFVPSTERWSDAYDIEYFTIAKANGNIYDVDISALNKEYDGTPADINQITFSTNVEVPLLVEWYKDETLLPSAPVDAGDYSIKLYSDDDNFIDTSYTGYFTISKKTLTLPSLDDIYLPEGEYVTLSEENGVIAGETVELYPDNDDHLCIGRYTDVALHITDDNYVLSGAAVASKYLVYEDISPYAVVKSVVTVKVGLNTFYVVSVSLIEGTIEVNKPLYLPTGETITPLSLSLDKTTTNMLSYADSGDKVLQISASGPKPEAGQIITDRIDHTDTVVFKAILYLHTEAEGGRHSPIMDGYKPSKIKMSDIDIVTSDITIKFIGDREMLLPGETAEVYFILGSKIPLRVGMTFDILEGTAIVGDGMISRLVEEEHDYSGDGVCTCGHSIVETISDPAAISKVFTADTYYYFKAPFEAGTYSYAFPTGVTGSITACNLDGSSLEYDSLYQERFEIPTDGDYLVIVKVNNPLNSTMTLILNTYL